MWNESPVQFDAWDGAGGGAVGWPRGMGLGGSWEGVSGWGHMYTHGGLKSVYGKTNIIL